MINKFLEHLKVERNLSGNTIEAYRGDLTLFSRNCKDVVKATQDNILDFIKDLEKYSPSTRNRIIFSSLASFYTYLISIGKITQSPIKGLKRAKVPKNDDLTILTDEEVKKMIKNMIGEDDVIKERNKLLVMLLVDTGLRISEATNLKIKDVVGNKLTVCGKGDKVRVTFISPATKRKLQEVINEFKIYGDFEYIFINQRGQTLSRTMAYNIIREVSEFVGLDKKVTPHIFRHTFASNYLRRGGTETNLKRLCGWSSNKMLAIYLHPTSKDLENEYKRTMNK